jgi:L-threonylcarbamoyladenylate synthase
MSKEKMTSPEEDIKKAGAVLRSRGVILYPTDTIWGLGCDAEDEEAVSRIFHIKQRPRQKSFIILMEGEEMLRRYVPGIPGTLADGMTRDTRPTTYILTGVKGVAPSVQAGDGTVAVRIPQDDFCMALLRDLGKAIVSTSANFAGAPPPRHFGEINPDLISKADYVVGWRQDDRTPARPSRIIRILPGGTREIIRE